MRPVILASVFLVVNCCCVVLNADLIREQPSKDFVKLTSKRRTKIPNRRFRRDVNKEDHPDVFNVNKTEGPCPFPTEKEGRQITKSDVSFGVAICRFFVYQYLWSR